MARYALIDSKSKIVSSVIEYDGVSIYFPPPNLSLIKSDDANAGDLYINGQFVQQG